MDDTNHTEEVIRTRFTPTGADRNRPINLNPHDARHVGGPVIDGLPADTVSSDMPPVAIPKTTTATQPPPPTDLGPGWQPIALPSSGLAGYPNVIHVRRFGFPDQARLKAAQHHRSTMLLCSAIGATIDIDPLKLTAGDFDYVLYWHRQNSYPANMPHVVEWRSRYNKINKSDIGKTKLTITSLESSDELEALREMGFDFPRMGALVWREAQEANLDVEKINLLDWAMNYSGGADTFDIEARMEKVNTLTDLSLLGHFDRWSRVSQHGVAESVSLSCKHFDPATALEDLASTLQRIAIETDSTTYTNADSVYVRSILDEIAAIQTATVNNTLNEVVAVADEVSIPLDVHMFFPAAE